jgi:hypothetical protein
MDTRPAQNHHMPHLSNQDFEAELSAGDSWRPWRDLALCVLVVLAAALIVSFLTATAAPEPPRTASATLQQAGHTGG